MTGAPWDTPGGDPLGDIQRLAAHRDPGYLHRSDGSWPPGEWVDLDPPPGEPDLDPASRAVARTPQVVEWTIGDALNFLHPCPPRRTIHRWLERMTPIGTRRLPQGGPEAKTYSAGDVMIRHRKWASRHG